MTGAQPETLQGRGGFLRIRVHLKKGLADKKSGISLLDALKSIL